MASDKLYISALSIKHNTLFESYRALQNYLDLGINPILTDTEILMSITDYSKTLLKPTDEIDVLNIYDSWGHEIYDWHVEMECRFDNVIQGKLIGRGIGSLRFIQKLKDSEFLLSKIMAPDRGCNDMVLRMSKRLGIAT